MSSDQHMTSCLWARLQLHVTNGQQNIPVSSMKIEDAHHLTFGLWRSASMIIWILALSRLHPSPSPPVGTVSPACITTVRHQPLLSKPIPQIYTQKTELAKRAVQLEYHGFRGSWLWSDKQYVLFQSQKMCFCAETGDRLGAQEEDVLLVQEHYSPNVQEDVVLRSCKRNMFFW